MQRTLRVGIIGTGDAARYHLHAYRRERRVQVVAVAGRTFAGTRSFARRFGIGRQYLAYKEMLEKERPDLVSICTPTALHARMSCDALAAGSHVFCEKPIARTVIEAGEMIAAARQYDRLLFISSPLLFMRAYQAVKSRLVRGDLGTVSVLWFRKGKWLPPQAWYRDTALSGGVSSELSVHGIELMKWLLDDRIVSVTAETGPSVYRLGKEDNIWFLVRFERGALGVIGSSYSYPFMETDFGITGDRAALRMVRGKIFVADLLRASSRKMAVWGALRESLVLPWRWGREHPFDGQVRYVVDRVQAGSEGPLLRASVAQESLACIEQALFSAITGARQTVPVVTERV